MAAPARGSIEGAVNRSSPEEPPLPSGVLTSWRSCAAGGTAMAVRAPGLEVVAPCPLRWDQLTGNDRVRFCGHCQQNVYNVASLTMDQALSLIQRCEGRVCM